MKVSLAVRHFRPLSILLLSTLLYPWMAGDVGCCLAQGTPQSADPGLLETISSIEKRFFSIQHTDESNESRMRRIEMMVYGAPQSGAFQTRVDQLKKIVDRANLPGPSSPLIGRLEEIGSKPVRLPAELRMTNGIPTSPASGKGAPLIQGKIASYPEEWLGQWGGAPGISSVYERIPVERIKKGSSGIVVFSFLKSDEGINLLPTNVFFPVTVTKLADQRLSEANLRKLEMRGETKGDQMMPGVPVIELRDSTYKSIRQENLKATVLRNILRLLKPDVLEQDIILCVRISGANEAPRYMYRESIIRLTRNRKDLLLVQIGHIGYAPTGERDFQYSMQGWLTPRWRSYATAIEKLVRSTVADLGYDELCTGMAESPKR